MSLSSTEDFIVHGCDASAEYARHRYALQMRRPMLESQKKAFIGMKPRHRGLGGTWHLVDSVIIHARSPMRRILKNALLGNDDIQAVRHFSRFYTRAIGTLQDRSLYKPFSLAEARVLDEIGVGDAQAREIAERLQLDEAYLSRILSKFEKSEFIAKETSSSDRRQNVLRLAPAGKKMLLDLNARSNQAVSALLKPLSSDQRVELLDAMRAVERLLTQEEEG